jgi:hypothetical protein
MRIAILSWGSLIQNGTQRGLRITGNWLENGPVLPVEFSRVSRSGPYAGCLTLVIDEQHGAYVPVRYAQSTHKNLDDALTNLRVVENIKLSYSVGYINRTKHPIGVRGWAMEHMPLTCVRIIRWADEHAYDAVIWTSLLPNFEKQLGTPFSVSNAIRYVNSLSEQTKRQAFEYIDSAPPEVTTPLRGTLEYQRVSVPPPMITPLHQQQRTTDEEEHRENMLTRFLNNLPFRSRPQNVEHSIDNPS